MVFDLPISEKSAYEAGQTIHKNYKEKGTNKDKISAKLENVVVLPEGKNTDKIKIAREENNNKTSTSFSISASILASGNAKICSRVKTVPLTQNDKSSKLNEHGISKSTSKASGYKTRNEENEDLSNQSIESALVTTAKNTRSIVAEREIETNKVSADISKERKNKKLDDKVCNSSEKLTPGKNYNAPLFIPSKALYRESAAYGDTNLYSNANSGNTDHCVYYPVYPSYYDSTTQSLPFYTTQTDSISYNNLYHNLSAQTPEKSQQNLVSKSTDKCMKKVKSNEGPTKIDEEKVVHTKSSGRLSVIETNHSTATESHFGKEKHSKEQIARMAAASVDCFTPSQYESHGGECTNNSQTQHQPYDPSNAEENSSFLTSHPGLSPITGNHGDLFINPAFAAHAMSGHGPVPQDPTAFMSFLADGSLVGPMGEIYCPPTDYFLVDTNGDIPPTLVSPAQGSNFDGKFQQMGNVGKFITHY